MTEPDRIDPVIELLTRLAAGDLDARGARTGSDEDLDAVIFGINMLAEELGASRTDLEQRVQARTRELEAARQEAMAATRVKSAFLATMSHEIRTPMNGVIGLTSLLLHTELDQTQRQYAQGLRDAGDALLTVIDDILDFSKLEAGMVDLEMVPFDPRQLVDGVAGLVAASAAHRELELIAHCLPQVPSLLVGDEGRLRQILLNLASNAVKFTEKGEVVIRASVVGAEHDRDRVRVRFEVTDTGIGIPLHARGHLFDSFTQADASTTRQYGGTGLGLAISRSLAEAMGGVIGVQSEEGVGSTFWFEVPLPVRTDRPAPAAGDDLLSGLRVLVVDDNATSRSVLSSQLREWGVRPDATASPAEVVRRMRAAVTAGDPYEVVVLDQAMPDLDGLELAAAISADELLAGSLLILLSATVELDREALGRAGIRDSLSKPVRSTELHARLGQLVSLGSPATRATTPQARGTVVEGRGRVLVVEDNPVNQMVAEGLVSHLGYDVDVVGDGAAAVAAVAATSYVAVLMDCHMPVMDGYAATAEIRQQEAAGARLPILAMTASATAEDRARCLAAGMDGFVSKPVDTATLGEALSRLTPGVPPAPATATEAGPERLDDRPALDLEQVAVLRRLGPSDGRGLLPALVETFATTSTAILAAIRQAAQDADSTTLQDRAHELAGVAANLGALEVAELARQLERTSAGGAPARDGLLDRLDAEAHRALGLLAEMLET